MAGGEQDTARESVAVGTDGSRHATWLELFFDLVFVAAITHVSRQLAAQSTWPGIGTYMALFLPIWWAWVGHTIYSNRFDHNDWLHRALTCLLMFAAAGMAVQLGRVPESGGLGFAIAYALARLALLLLYGREASLARSPAVSRLYLRGFGLGVAFWGLSLFVSPPLRYVCWAIGFSVDLVVPWLGRPTLQRFPLNVSHLPERIGLFILIVLGESLVIVTDSLAQEPWTTTRLIMAGAAFLTAFAIWSSYFAFVERTRFECRLGSGQPYIYTHLPVSLGLTSLVAGVERAIHLGSTSTLDPISLGLLGVGAIVWCLGFLGVQLVSYGQFPRRQVVVYLGASTALLLLTLLGPRLSPSLFFCGMTIAFLAVSVLTRRGPGNPPAPD